MSRTPLEIIDGAIRVIQAQRKTSGDGADHQADELRKARAAVAELIGAAKDEQAQACGNFAAKSCGHDGYCICPGDRLRTALARVGGA